MSKLFIIENKPYLILATLQKQFNTIINYWLNIENSRHKKYDLLSSNFYNLI